MSSPPPLIAASLHNSSRRGGDWHFSFPRAADTAALFAPGGRNQEWDSTPAPQPRFVAVPVVLNSRLSESDAGVGGPVKVSFGSASLGAPRFQTLYPAKSSPRSELGPAVPHSHNSSSIFFSRDCSVLFCLLHTSRPAQAAPRCLPAANLLLGSQC